MNCKSLKILFSLVFLLFVLSGCAEQMKKMKKKKTFKHDTPLIKDDVKKLGKAEVDKTVKMGPTPAEADVIKLKKRKKISSVKEKNYLLIPDEFTALKQQVSFKFQNMDYTKAMGMMAEIGGKEDGYCRGKGGSMHIADNDLGHLGANAIVGGGISHVVGAGLSYKYLGKDQAAVAFFGDGAMQQGGLYESMNLAALWKLPVMFVCINNEYGMGTRLDRASASLEFAKRAETFGLNGLEVDGLDVTQVHHKAQKLMEGVRNGDSAFLKVDCYRFHGHARKDKSHYREDLEEQKGREKDPILHLEDRLIKGSMNTGDLEQIKSEINNEMDEAMEYALNSTEPESIQRFQDVYAPDSPEPLPVDERIRKALNAS